MARGDWSLTVRHGPRVQRMSFADLDPALTELHRRVEEIRAAGPLAEVKAFRDYEPGARINARLELSRGGMFRSTTAGVDLMGDGRLVPYRGSVRRRELDLPDGAGSEYEALRAALT